MKRAIVGSAAAAFLLAIVVMAAVAPAPSAPPPVGPSQVDLDAYAQQMLDATWDSTGLAGPRPVVDPGELRMPADDSVGWDISDCMNAAGYVSFGWSTGSETGFTLTMVDGSDDPDDAAQMAWYLCVAQHPVDSSSAFMLRTPSQRAARFDFQIEQVAPCLTLLGYHVAVPYSKDEAVQQDATGFAWSAYDAVWTATEDPSAYEAALAVCGGPELAL